MRTVITPTGDSLIEYLLKIWHQRAFIIVLAKRDLKVKYAQTAIGLGWSLIQPLTAVFVFTIFFGVLLDLETSYPYPLYVLSGVACWNLFNFIFSHGSNSLIDNQDLIRKLAFPRMVLPISKVLVALVEFCVVMLLMIPLFIWFQTPIQSTIVFMPLVLLCFIIFSLGVSLILAAATLKNRDLHHIIPFLINFGIWLTPVFYPISLIPEEYSDYLYLNPMASLIAIFRWSIFGGEINSFVILGVVISIIFLAFGIVYFRFIEDRISDTV